MVEKLMIEYHSGAKLLAEHALLPIHLAVAAHATGLAVLLATLTVSTYIAATFYQAKAKRMTNNV